MSQFKFYLSYPLNNQEYSDFVEVTSDIYEKGASNLKRQLDSNEYDIGTIRYNNLKLTFRNETAKYSEAINQQSIFTFKRDQSILKIEWTRNTYDNWCGSAPCGLTFLTEPVEVWKGFLSDNTAEFDTDAQTIQFQFLSEDSLLSKDQVPFSNLDVSDDIETTIYNILNTDKITRFLTVDQSNISVANNFVPDSIAHLETQTILQALRDILFISGAVLYVEESTIFVKSREVGATSKATFYGPASDNGIENLLDLKKYTLGLNRTFNQFIWEETTIKQEFLDSIDKWDLRQKVVNSKLLTDSGKRTTVLNTLLVEFGFPKIELEIEVPMTTEFVKDIRFLDKINIDYPADYRGSASEPLPARYGKAKYGESQYIKAVTSLIIDPNTDWKVMNISISIIKHTLKFRVREV